MPKILDAFTNFARTSLISGINTSATVFSTVANGDYNRFPDGSNGNFKLTIYNSTDYKNPSDDPLREIVWCTGRSANTFTIIRPSVANNYLEEGATNIAQNHNLGNKIYSIVLSITKGTIDAIDTKLQTIDTNDTQTVHITGNESIDGIKTFTSSPIIPTPTTDLQAATKKYVDDQIGGENLFDKSGNTITTHTSNDNLDIGGIIKTDTINEHTTNNGTTVNGVLIKSGLVDGVSVSGHVANNSIHFTQSAISIPHTQINDFTSAVDSEINNQLTAQKGVANGIATLDTNTQVPIAQIPNITSSKVTDFQSAVNTNTNVAANTAARHSHSNKSTLDLINQDVSNTATPTFNQITINNTPTAGNDVATKSYVDSNVSLKLAQIQSIATNPASLTPTIGQRWIIGTSAIGVWSGKDTKIAKWNGSGWDYTDSLNGQREYNLTLDVDYEFKGGSWVVLADSIEHNKTKNIQGGNSTEKYHLTSAEYDIATQPANNILSGYINTTSQNIAGVKTFSNIPIIPTTTPTLDGQIASKSYVDYGINQLNRFDKQLFNNQTGSIIPRYTIVQVNGSYNIDNLPTVTTFTGGSNTPIAITYEDMSVGATDTLLIRGRQDITGFDTTSYPIGTKVYANYNGTLTFSPTTFAVGITMNQQVNGYIYFDFSGIFNYITPDKIYAAAETPSGTINGTNKVFNLTISPSIPSSTIVILNGVVQYYGIDYTVSGSTITFVYAPTTGSSIFAYYNKAATDVPLATIWGSITGTLSNQADLQSALDAKANLITTYTKTQTDSNFEPKNSNIQSHISSTSNPHNTTKSQIGLGNVPNVDTTNPANIIQDTTHRFVTDTEKATWNAGSSVLSVNGYTGAVVLNKTDIGLSNVPNLSFSGSNTGDETVSTIKAKLGITTLSGSNTGDDAVNSLYSGLAASKQDTLVSGTNIKTVNSQSLLGSGDIVIAGGTNYFQRSGTVVSPATAGDTIQTTSINSPLNAGPITQPTITFGTNTMTIPTVDCYLFSNTLNSGPITKYTIPQLTNYAMTDNAYYYVYVDYNAGTPQYAITTDFTILDNSTKIGVAQVIHEVQGTIDEYKVFYNGTYGYGLSNKQALRLIRTQRFAWENGLALGVGGSQNITTTEGYFWFDGERVHLNETDSAIANAHFYYHSSGNWTASEIATFNNTQYDNGTNLVTLTNNRYAVNWVYVDITQNDNDVYVVLGSGDYNTLALASAAPIPSSLPTIIQKSGLLVGRIIVQKGSITPAAIDSAFTTTLNSSSTTDHANLSNLLWNASGHTDGTNSFAGFNGTGAATTYPISNYATTGFATAMAIALS